MIELLLLLQYATPVGLAALGETVGQKSGVINIGLEGMMLLAAFFATWTSLSTGSPWLGMVAGCGVGIVSNLVSAAFTVQMGIDQVVVGTAMNLLALGLTGTLFRARFGQTGSLLTVPSIPKFVGVDFVVMAMVLLVPLTALLLKRTAWGLAVRAAGEYPKAAEASGFNVLKLRVGASAYAGLLAGAAGAYLSLGIAGSFAENMTNGRGFIAIAMVTFGRWKPLYVLLSALLIGYLDSLQFTLQAKGSAVPFQLLLALPYVAALAVLVVVGKGTSFPAALARPYTRNS